MVKRTESDKLLKVKTFKIASNPNYHGYQRELTSIVYKLLDKNYDKNFNKSMSNQQLEQTMNFVNQSLENVKGAKSIILLKKIFAELILLICK